MLELHYRITHVVNIDTDVIPVECCFVSEMSSKTPHPTLSSARIASQNKLLPKTNKKPYSQKLKGRNPITPGRTASQTPQ